MKALEAEVQAKQALVQQLQQENDTLNAKARMLEAMVSSGDMTLNLLQQVQKLKLSDTGSTDPSTTCITSEANTSSMGSSIPRSISSGVSSSSQQPTSASTCQPPPGDVCICSGNNSLPAPPVLVDDGGAKGYAYYRPATESMQKVTRAIVQLRDTFKSVVAQASPLLLQLEYNPNDPQLQLQLHTLMDQAFLRIHPFTVLNRLSVYYLRTSNLETNEMNQVPPEGHWRRVSQLMSEK